MEPNTKSCDTSSSPERARTTENDENTRDHRSHKLQQINHLQAADAALGYDCPVSSHSTGSAITSPTQTSLPPRASLLGLPRELRDKIYEHLAETEDRIVLGWRFVEAYKFNDDTLSLDECFDSAVALHPLSMSCKQMYAEFQDVHFSASEARWTLLVNNFDLEQLILFDDYIDSRVFIAPIDWAYDETFGFSRPEFNVNLNLRFQMDYNAARSVKELCELFLSDEHANSDTLCALKRCAGISAEVAINCTPRTTASAKQLQTITKQEARSVLSAVKNLYYLLKTSKVSRRFETYERIKRCWFVPFSKAVRSMRGERNGKRTGTDSRLNTN